MRSWLALPRSTMCHEAGIFSAGERLVLGPAGDLLGDDHVDRQDDLDAVLLGGRQDPPGVLDPVRLGQALADRLALGEQERVGHAAAEDEHVDLGQEVVDDPILSETLAPPRIAANGRSGDSSSFDRASRSRAPSAARRRPAGASAIADGGGMRAMGRAERVVDVDVGVRRQGRGERRVVLLLLGVEAEVLEEQHLARPQALDARPRCRCRARRR